MKNYILQGIVLAGILFGGTVTAQTEQYPERDRCATMPALEYFKQQHPGVEASMAHGEEAVAKWIAKHGHERKGGTLVIPTVVHVLYDPAEPVQNIADSVIHSQIQVLNEDFRRLNADAANTRAGFDSIAVSLDIEFCLATRDPNGNWTNGITRTSTTADFSFTPFTNNVKRTADGGMDPWPPGDYLNIWICDMSFFGQPAVLGYAQFPLSSDESIQAGAVEENDGIVIQYQYFGKTYNPNTAPSNLGRTTTHEVGHWLGLRHIWGDGDCNATDYVDDTPNAAAQANFDCNLSINSCDDSGGPFWQTDPPDMIENFMDYSADDCMNMFSNGQSMRAWGFLNTDSLRNSLFNSQGCSAPTGMPDGLLAGKDVQLYPNPTTGYFKMEWPSAIENPVVRVVNELGQEVFSARATSQMNQLEIDLTDECAGLYFATIITDYGIVTKKLILE